MILNPGAMRPVECWQRELLFWSHRIAADAAAGFRKARIGLAGDMKRPTVLLLSFPSKLCPAVMSDEGVSIRHSGTER
jgi:hypothetical protein